MSYECINARFLFFNGQKKYTVEFAYALTMWFVFKDEKTTDALWKKKINPAQEKSPNRTNAEGVLNEYLQPSKY